MNHDQLLLIDLSALSHQIYHVSGNEPDPSYVSNQIVARVRALSTEHPHAAICCDAPPYLRKDIDPTYKATRPEAIGPLLHQMAVAEERLAKDGYPIWKVKGYEADDIIATAVRMALGIDGASVLIASSDKDLLQLVGPNVTAKSLTNGAIADEAAVLARFGVRPDQMLDYLCLVGDSSDNIVGAKGIGAVKAAALLKEFGTLTALYQAMADGDVKPRGVTPALRSSLVEFQPRWPTVRSLVSLRSDVPIPFEEIAAERMVEGMTEEPEMRPDEDAERLTSGVVDIMEREMQRRMDEAGVHDPYGLRARQDRELTGPEAAKAAGEALNAAMQKAQNGAEPVGIGSGVMPGPTMPEPRQPLNAMADPARNAIVASYGTPVDFSQQLEPRSMTEARDLAQRMFDSKLFNAYGTPQAVLAVILTGREFGMGAMSSLRGHHIIEGKAVQSADTIAGIVLSSGKAKYFKPTQRSATAAAFKTLRKGEEEDPFELVYTIEEARLAWKKDERAWAASGWGKNPTDMLVARAKAKLARLIYPDVVGGMYAPEEFE